MACAKASCVINRFVLSSAHETLAARLRRTGIVRLYYAGRYGTSGQPASAHEVDTREGEGRVVTSRAAEARLARGFSPSLRRRSS